MVEDRITDGKRIAQLLASELTGQSTPLLDRVSIVDATPDVEPTAEGVEAYGVAVDDERVGAVTVYPESVLFTVAGTIEETSPGAGLAVETDSEEVRVRIEYGAAVKRVVDLFEAVV